MRKEECREGGRGDEMGNRYFHTMRVRVMMLGAMCEGAGELGSERAVEQTNVSRCFCRLGEILANSL